MYSLAFGVMVAAVKTAAESLELPIVVPFYNEAENNRGPARASFEIAYSPIKSDPDNLSADKEKTTPKNIPPRLCGG